MRIKAQPTVANPFRKEFRNFAEMPGESLRFTLPKHGHGKLAAVISADTPEDPKERTVMIWKKTKNKPAFIKTTCAFHFTLQHVVPYQCETVSSARMVARDPQRRPTGLSHPSDRIGKTGLPHAHIAVKMSKRTEIGRKDQPTCLGCSSS